MLNQIRSAKERLYLSIKYPKDIVTQKWHLQYARRLIKYKNLHRGEDCFIIGNGPSLNNMDLERLNGYHTFGLNKIYLMFEKISVDLSYHVSVNKLVIEQSISEFKELDCSSFLSYQKSINLVDSSKNVNFIYTSGRPYMFQTDMTKALCEGNTVTYVAMQIAFYMGFERVFLIGVDHNFKCNGNPNEKQFLKNADLNHFDSRYFENQEWHLPDLEASELSFRLADFHFKREGKKIYDATENGKLFIFEKISFEKSLDLCKKREKKAI